MGKGGVRGWSGDVKSNACTLACQVVEALPFRPASVVAGGHSLTSALPSPVAVARSLVARRRVAALADKSLLRVHAVVNMLARAFHVTLRVSDAANIRLLQKSQKPVVCHLVAACPSRVAFRHHPAFLSWLQMLQSRLAPALRGCTGSIDSSNSSDSSAWCGRSHVNCAQVAVPQSVVSFATAGGSLTTGSGTRP